MEKLEGIGSLTKRPLVKAYTCPIEEKRNIFFLERVLPKSCN